MGAAIIVILDPFVKVLLQLFQIPVDLLPECHPVELVENCLVERLTDPIRLGTSCPGFGMFYLMILKKNLIGMFIRSSTELSSSISQDPQDVDSLIIEEGQNPVIQSVSGCDRDLGRVEFGKGNRGIGAHRCLLIDSSYAFEIANIEGIRDVPFQSRLDHFLSLF